MEVKNTRKPPIQLKDHFFTDVQVKADPAVAKEIKKGKEFGYTYKLDVECSKVPKTSLEYQVQLTIEASELPSCLKGYDITLVVVGIVQVDAQVEKKRQEGLAAVLGASLLYSAAREFLYSATLRGPFPPVYLPTTSFIPEKTPAGETEENTTPADKSTAETSTKPKDKKKSVKKT